MAYEFKVDTSHAIERVTCNGHDHVSRVSRGGSHVAVVAEYPDGTVKVQSCVPVRKGSTPEKQANEYTIALWIAQLDAFL